MLTEGDINLIKANRSELLANRTTTVTLVTVTQSGSDPYTGEPIESESTQQASVIWKEYSTVSNGERQVIGGVELLHGDVKVTFDEALDLSTVDRVTKDGVDYRLVTTDPKGLGGTNRQEALVRKVT